MIRRSVRAMSDAGVIPRVDFARIALTRADEEITDKDWMEVGQQLLDAFIDIGFCYMEQHGVSEQFRKSQELAKQFFALPMDAKARILRSDPQAQIYGWLPLPQTKGLDVKPEHLDLSRPPDYKEIYQIHKASPESLFPTENEVTGFREATVHLIDCLETIFRRCLTALSHVLKLDDPTALQDLVKKLGTRENYSLLRYAFYPAVPPALMTERQMRCAEHTDFGLITFVFQDRIPGLQVFTRSGQYVDVLPVDGSILVNVGDSLERITGGILRSAKHRVVVDAELAAFDRYSIIYYPASDHEATLQSLCGDKEKYREKITTDEFMKRRFTDIFERGKGLTSNATA